MRTSILLLFSFCHAPVIMAQEPMNRENQKYLQSSHLKTGTKRPIWLLSPVIGVNVASF